MIKHRIILGIAAMLFVLSACDKESGTTTGITDEQDVTITVKTGTRAVATPDQGSIEDRYINSLRILGYRAADGMLAFNIPLYGIPSAQTGTEDYEGAINIKTGRFTFIFIANEHSDATLSGKLNGITMTSNNTLAYLKSNATFSDSAFASDKDIPMATIKENVVIQGDNKFVDPEIQATPITGKWLVSMKRLGIRIDLSLTLHETSYTQWYQYRTSLGRVFINNVPKKVYLFPQTDNSSDVYSNNEIYTWREDWPNSVHPATDANFNKTVVFERIILPESYFTPVDTKAKGLQLKILVGYNERKGTVNSGIAGYGYTLPRNTYLKIDSKLVNELVYELSVQSVEDWTDENIGHDL